MPALQYQDYSDYQAYRAWDAPTRWFHCNVLTVIWLIATGLIVLNGDALGLSDSSKILLKSAHVAIGYLTGINLVWRFV